MPLVQDACLTREGGGYPVLTGRLGGHRVTLRPIVDAVTLRKLPVLWVELVVHRTLEVEGTVNVLLRPLGTEFFSPDSGFAHELAPPPGLPRPVRVACVFGRPGAVARGAGGPARARDGALRGPRDGRS